MFGKQRFRRRIYSFNGQYRFVASDWKQSLQNCELAETGQWCDLKPADVVLETDTTQVYRVPTDSGVVYFKRYSVAPGGKNYLMRPSRGACEWAGLHALDRAGLPVPKLVAFGEDRSLGRLTGAYIVTAEIEGAVNLEEYAIRHWYGLTAQHKRQVFYKIRDQVFNLVKKSHQSHLYHRDLFWRNILIRCSGDDYELWFIDCPRLLRTRLRAGHSRMTDLSCLARASLSFINRSERFRALTDFFDGDAKRARALFREIQSHHDRSRHPPKVFNPGDLDPQTDR
ncbi:MAG: lipopolysaccharide kinase InaA family protein [Pseudomonadota bacterium]